jgi:lycopene cyclase domain-containing protein
MDRWQYLMVLGACLVITAPLEWLGRGVYRKPWRAVCAVLPVAAVFIVWDVLAIATDVWTYNPRYVTGIKLPASLPVEELLFFLAIPLCGLLTYAAVDAILARLRRLRARTVRSP